MVGRCGCCQPPSPATPLPVTNAPALDAVAYRVGTYAAFRQAMIELVGPMADELAAEVGLPEPPLGRWTSRASDDHGIALMEMWATIGDILTFHTERYVTEAWLRTAEHHDSVRRLAGLLGYRPGPGLAAGTYLSYRLDDGRSVRLEPGLLVQSVPAEGEQPQKFETTDPVEADSSLNRVDVFGTPVVVDALTAGREAVTLAPDSALPTPGQSALLFTPGASPIEERLVEGLDHIDDRPVVRWSRALDGDHAEAHLRGRSFRLFGHGAPDEQIVATTVQGSTVDGVTAQSIAWDSATTDFVVSNNELDIEGTVDGIEVGSWLAIVGDGNDGVVRRRAVQAVEHLSAPLTATTPAGTPVDVMQGPVTRITVGRPDLDLNRQTCRIHELTGRLRPLGWEVPETPIPAGTSTIHVAHPEVEAVEAKRRLILDDGLGEPMVIETAGPAAPLAMTPDGPAEFLAIPLANPTTRDLDPTTAHLLGNVVAATHGETVAGSAGEVVGDGEASLALQEFTLAKSPVTHTTDPTAPGGARSSVEILVDGVRWAPRVGLYGAGPNDRVYTTLVDDEQEMTVRFGDGRTGARLPTGRGNVTARYRQGLGQAGNLLAGQLATALDKPTGVAGVTNPLAAAGGVDPETVEGTRVNAPTTVRTFDRAVSLRDLADLARTFVGIEKALATWTWDGEERIVHLTVGGTDGHALSADQLAALRAYLDQRRDPNRSLRIDDFRPVPFRIGLTVEADPNHRNDDLGTAVVATVEAAFAYENRGFGQAVHLSDLYALAHDVEGVVAAQVDRLTYANPIDRRTHGAPAGQRVLVHAPVRGARTRPDGTIEPAELAVLEPQGATGDDGDEGDEGLTVTVHGGLPS